MENEKKKLAEALRSRYGSIAEIARRTKKTQDYVQKVLSGKYFNSEILIVASTVLTEKLEEEKRVQEAIAQSVDQLADYEQC